MAKAVKAKKTGMTPRQEIMYLKGLIVHLRQEVKDLQTIEESMIADRNELKSQKEEANEALKRIYSFLRIPNPFDTFSSYPEISEELITMIAEREEMAVQMLASERMDKIKLQEELRIRMDTLRGIIALLANK